MTNSNTKDIRDLFADFYTTKFKVFRRSSMKSTYEIIITNIYEKKPR